MQKEYSVDEMFYRLAEKKEEIKDFISELYDRLADPETGHIHGCPYCKPLHSDRIIQASRKGWQWPKHAMSEGKKVFYNNSQDPMLWEIPCLPTCKWREFWFYKTKAEAQIEHLDGTLEASLELKADQITSSVYWECFEVGEREEADNIRRRIDAILAKDFQLTCFDELFDWVLREQRPAVLAKAYYSMATYHCKKKAMKNSRLSRCFTKLWYDNRVAIINMVADRIVELQPNAKGFKHFDFIDDLAFDPAIDTAIQHNEDLA